MRLKNVSTHIIASGDSGDIKTEDWAKLRLTIAASTLLIGQDVDSAIFAAATAVEIQE